MKTNTTAPSAKPGPQHISHALDRAMQALVGEAAARGLPIPPQFRRFVKPHAA